MEAGLEQAGEGLVSLAGVLGSGATKRVNVFPVGSLPRCFGQRQYERARLAERRYRAAVFEAHGLPEWG